MFRFSPDFRLSFKCKIKISHPVYIAQVAGHTHDLGKHVGIFIKQLDDKNNDKGWTRVFEKPNPDFILTQAIEPPVRIDSSFELATRCIYDTTNVTHRVGFGFKHADEMCVAVIFYYVEDDDVTLDDCMPGKLAPDELNQELPEQIEITQFDDQNEPPPTQNVRTSFLLLCLAFAMFSLSTGLILKRRMAKCIILNKFNYQSLLSK